MQDHTINKSIELELDRLEKKRRMLQKEVAEFTIESNKLRTDV
jgi:hypothetical protein